MILSHLKIKVNEIIVRRNIKDRDGDTSSTIDIGSGYGMFRSKSLEELNASGTTEYGLVGLLAFFNSSIGDPIQSGDIATWRDQEYYIASVAERYDVFGKFAGYWLECGKGRASRV